MLFILIFTAGSGNLGISPSAQHGENGRLCIFAALRVLLLSRYLCSVEFQDLGVFHCIELKSSLQISTFVCQGRGSQQGYIQECVKVCRSSPGSHQAYYPDY